MDSSQPSRQSADATVDSLRRYVDASPSPYHAVIEGASRLDEAGFTDGDAGTGVTVDGGMLFAWRRGRPDGARIIVAHTDSPNLRIKPHPDRTSFGIHQIATEPYGGALVASWLDRDLGVSGRVTVRSDNGAGYETLLFRADEALLRLPQLAIHLDREVNERGLVVDRQRHLNALWALERDGGPEFADWLADRLATTRDRIVAWDLMCHDVTPASLSGRDGGLLASGRLDNLVSCWGAVEALCTIDGEFGDPANHPTVVVALFDHEEVGSESATGAASPRLGRLLDQLEVDRTTALVLSADMAHGCHPNHADRHEPGHPVVLGGGPAIKTNVNQRYATDARSAAAVDAACRSAGLNPQTYVHRADMACGSTVGPMTASRLGIATADVGLPMLAMHSARETMATADVPAAVGLFAEWLRGRR